MYDLSARYCFFDTETSDMIKFKLTNSDPSQPWACQIAALVTDSTGLPLHKFSSIIHSHGLLMMPGAESVHNISKLTCDTVGIQAGAALGMLLNFFDSATHIVAHNISFDLRILKIMAARIAPQAIDDLSNLISSRPQICTMRTTTDLCCIPYPSGRKGNKWPKLEELYNFLFSEPLLDAHDALVDVEATAKCFFKLNTGGFFNVAN